MGDIREKITARNISELTAEDLNGHEIADVKCRACSGYGACGYKTFFMFDGSPYSVCNLRLEKIRDDEVPMASGNEANPEGEVSVPTGKPQPSDLDDYEEISYEMDEKYVGELGEQYSGTLEDWENA